MSGEPSRAWSAPCTRRTRDETTARRRPRYFIEAATPPAGTECKSAESALLITGGAGFIGSELARQALAAGARVTVGDAAVGQTVNLGSGSEISINELAGEIRRVLDLPAAAVEHVEPRPGDVLRLCADTAKARRLFGYRPRVCFSEGLARLRKWYGAQGVTAGALLEKEVLHNWRREERGA